jgi:hypothetical protein
MKKVEREREQEKYYWVFSRGKKATRIRSGLFSFITCPWYSLLTSSSRMTFNKGEGEEKKRSVSRPAKNNFFNKEEKEEEGYHGGPEGEGFVLGPHQVTRPIVSLHRPSHGGRREIYEFSP